MASRVIEARDLTGGFGELEVVKALNLEVNPGHAPAVLGPNRAGKSTTIGKLCTLIKPTSGTARVAGFDVIQQADQVRSRIRLAW